MHQQNRRPEDSVSVAAHLQTLKGGMSESQRKNLLGTLPRVLDQEVESLGERVGEMEFRGSLLSGERVVFIPIDLAMWNVPKYLSIYGPLSRSVNLQRFFGIFQDTSGDYAVMEDLTGEGTPFMLLKTALSSNRIAESSSICRLRLCHEIAMIVAYLHSTKIVVKVISDSSIFLRKVNEAFIPVMTNLEHTREVLPAPPCLTEPSLWLAPTTLVMTNATIPRSMAMVLERHLFIPLGQICGGQSISHRLLIVG